MKQREDEDEDGKLLFRILRELKASEDVTSLDYINIDVVDGVVLLGGTAISLEEREIIEEIIEGTPGVKGINNAIDV